MYICIHELKTCMHKCMHTHVYIQSFIHSVENIYTLMRVCARVYACRNVACVCIPSAATWGCMPELLANYLSIQQQQPNAYPSVIYPPLVHAYVYVSLKSCLNFWKQCWQVYCFLQASLPLFLVLHIWKVLHLSLCASCYSCSFHILVSIKILSDESIAWMCRSQTRTFANTHSDLFSLWSISSVGMLSVVVTICCVLHMTWHVLQNVCTYSRYVILCNQYWIIYALRLLHQNTSMLSSSSLG